MPRLLRFLTLSVALLPLVLSACGGSSTGPKHVEEIVVFGYLYVGEPVSGTAAIRIDRTLPVDQYYDVRQAAIVDAVVTLRAEGAAVTDTLPMTAPGVYANPDLVIRERTTYHLQAFIGGETITASTTTPFEFEALLEPRTVVAGAMPQSAIADSFPIEVACPDREQIFLVDVYCTEDWAAARFVHRIGGDRDTPQSYEDYGGANGEPRHIAAYFRLNDIPESDQGYLINFYGDMMWFYGEYQVGVFAIDENYYRYLYRDHPERNAGIRGGIGVFGSACRKQYRVRVI